MPNTAPPAPRVSPGNRRPADDWTATSKSPQRPPAELLVELNERIEQYCSRQFDDPSIVEREISALSRVVRELSRAGPEHAIRAGFGCVTETILMLLVRLTADVRRQISLQDSSGNARNMDLPPRVLAALPTIDSLTNLHLKLADNFARFEHVLGMKGKKGEHTHNRQPRQRNRAPVGRHPSKNGKLPQGSGMPRIPRMETNVGGPTMQNDPVPAAG